MRWDGLRRVGVPVPLLLLLCAGNGGPSGGGHPGDLRRVDVVRGAIQKKRYGEQKIANAHLARPGIWFEPFRINGYPRSHPRFRKVARAISSVAAGVRALGGKPRLCIDFRPDVYRVLGGARDTARGLGPFDDAWIAQVPVADHNAAVAAYDRTRVGPAADVAWADELSDARCKGFDRDRTGALLRAPYSGTLSSGTCPLFYASGVRDAKPTAFQWGGYLVTDMRIEAERRWMARNLADRIADTGATCAIVGYKPGWYAYNDTGSHASRCWQPGDRNWSGIARPTRECRGGGLLDQTPYAPGEFRAALNDFLSRTLELAASSPGVCDWYLVTVERPDYAGRRWTLLDPAVRSHPCLLGEWGSDPPL